MSNIILQGLTLEQLQEFIQVAVNNAVADQQPSDQPTTDQPEFITPKEASELLKVSPVTLWRYQKQGKVKCYGIGGRRLYKRDEIIESLTLKKQ